MQNKQALPTAPKPAKKARRRGVTAAQALGFVVGFFAGAAVVVKLLDVALTPPPAPDRLRDSLGRPTGPAIDQARRPR